MTNTPPESTIRPYPINHELQQQITELKIRLLALEKDFHDYKESQVGQTITKNNI